MKKILILLGLLFIVRVNAIEDIKIDNNKVIPSFNKNIKIYNYYTENDNINIEVKKNKNETISGDGNYHLDKMQNDFIITNGKEKYTVHVFKKYDKNYKEESYIKNITVEGYNIDFDRNKHNYEITIQDENNLNIDYELSNLDDKLEIIGNGNYNKTDNVIKIILNNKDEYTIHVLKTQNVSSLVKDEIEYKELSSTKKEIVKIIIITISCIFVFMFYYLLFIY